MADLFDRVAREPDSVAAYGAHPAQVVDVYRSAEWGPTVLLVHGGYWRARYDRMHLRPMAEALASRGLTVVLPEYRRIGDEGGGWPAALDDVRAAVEWASSAGLAPDVVAGHSAGGHLAVRAFTEAPGREAWVGLAATPLVVALAGVLDLAEAHRGRYSDDAVGELLSVDAPGFAERLASADPLGLPSPVGGVHLVHGTADEDVPVVQSRSYARAHPDAALSELEGADHFDLIDPTAPAFAAVVEALTAPRS
ncbi:lipase [Cnuibacter physcomitrellae]|uniref:Uncharacterized protein n=1 Tax=Cnuibacter physcomitrellae TaxID=1619308 RepID=A0A1X9LFY7_9MICO|nr:alpha/beta hydrolase [Cnuibacter physcomitrellae]ARJ04094.1 hypothetical protein B5808_01785 [Cnuibacter physcomitrellae]GGI40246.1 lipase [Cnuibacter physcomitrellae]